MARPKKRQPGDEGPEQITIESRVMASLEASGAHAMTEKELQKASGVTGSSFKEVLIRLVFKGMVVKWKNERQVNYIVARQFAFEAYYDDTLTLDALYMAIGHTQQVLSIKRTIPFVLSPDEETRTNYNNRYKDIKAAMGH